jgi:4'-phosphopantetheinyl transferase EntD
MTTTRNLPLQHAIEAVTMPAIMLDHRVIENGDELALLPEELDTFVPGVTKVRRASGAARIVARELMLRLGHAQRAVPKSASGMPIWPTGIVGSLAHDSEVSVAAIALEREFSSLGVDVEPAEALDSDLLDFVVTENERRNIGDDPCRGRLFFSIKESVYKAVYPLDGTFLDHLDVEVCLASKTAIVRNGRIVNFRYCIATHIVALAFISA